MDFSELNSKGVPADQNGKKLHLKKITVAHLKAQFLIQRIRVKGRQDRWPPKKQTRPKITRK